MNREIPTEEPPVESPDKPSVEEKTMEQGAKEEIGKMFDENESSTEKVQAVKDKIASFLENRDLLEEGEAIAITQQLDQCTSIADREEFIEEVLGILTPIIALQETKPRAFEAARRETFVRESKVTALNEILSYGEGYFEGNNEDDKIVHIHFAPATTLSVNERRNLVIDGLQKLAKIVEDDKTIKEVTATSWIVARVPRLMTKLGFTVKGPIDEETRARHFEKEKRPVSKAGMSRDDFLAEYIKD